MRDDHNQRIQELFLAALELPAEQREAWLAGQCGADDELLREVRSLLEHDNPDDDPLEKRLDEALDVSNTVVSAATAEGDVGKSEVVPMDSEEFISKLSKVGVLSAEEIQALNQTIASGQSSSDPRQIASQLVAAGKLTDYQAAALLKGQPDLLIDKYLILDLLDAGGMGMVFKAIHRPMNRTVAIKMIAQHLLTSPEQVKRFQREVRVAATLEHPNIVRSYDADQSRGVHFLVMEYVRGENLTKTVQRQGPLSVEMAVDCVRQAAKGLRYAHKKGVIHRDIKPGNLMLNDEGLVKVLDLGLANIDESFRLAQQSSITGDPQRHAAQSLAESELTAAGTVLGTVSFMAPEQSLDSHTADTRADIYSLGCTLYYLLVGEAPYKGETIFQVFMQHREAEIPSLRDKRPDVPEKVETVCRKMLAKSPEDRFQSMGELLAALDDCDIAPPPETVKPVKSQATGGSGIGSTVAYASQESRTGRQSKSHNLLGWLTTLVLLLALGGGYWWWQSMSGQHETPTDVAHRDVADGNKSAGTTTQPLDSREPSLYEMLTSGEWEWSEPEVVANVNSGGWDGPACLSADGLSLIFQSNWRAGGIREKDLWMSTRSARDEPWSDPVNLGLPINSRFHERDPSISDDALTLVFSSDDRPGGKGGSDLWMSTRASPRHNWSEPVNLELNTEGYEARPFLSADGLTLLFGSVRPGGFGRIDVWMATRSSPSETWGEPQNLGPGVNSALAETGGCYSANEQLLVFDRGSDPEHFCDLWMSIRESQKQPWQKGSLLGSQINTPSVETGPSLSADGRELYFQRYNDDGSGANIMVSRLVRKQTPVVASKPAADLLNPGEPPLYEMLTSGEWEWSEPEVVENVNSGGWDGPACLSADGLSLAFSSNRGGGIGKGDLWMSTRLARDAPWSGPVNLGPPVNTKFGEEELSISGDGLTLVFTSFDRPGEKGGRDLWMSTRTSKSHVWSEPENLELNTEGYDGKPFLSADGLTLLFSSARSGGYGGPDIWMATRTSPSDSWSEPQNLGPGVNSGLIEGGGCFSNSGQLLVFDRGDGRGSWDLWMSIRESQKQPWQKGFLLGPQINTPSVETGPSLSADWRELYFQRYKDDGSGANIMVSRLVRKQPPVVAPKPAAHLLNPGEPPLYEMLTSGEWDWSDPEVVENVNLGGWEGPACLSADGLSLIFQSYRNGGVGRGDLWMSTRSARNAPWSDPVNLGPPVNTKFGELHPSISGDALTLAFTSGDRPNGRGDGDVWMSTRTSPSHVWSEPKNLELNTKGYEARPFLSADGLTLLFGSNRPGGYGSSDIWMATRSSGSEAWGEPQNLGPGVNSALPEGSACFSGNGQLLVFDRGPDLGHSDLWMSIRESQKQPWQKGSLLGSQINTPSVETSPSLSADGRELYFQRYKDDGSGANIMVSRLVRKQAASTETRNTFDSPDGEPSPVIAPRPKPKED